MRIDYRGYEFHFPTPDSTLHWSNWEILGMAAWLWTRSPLHRAWNLALFEQEIADSIQLGQFVLLIHRNQPAGYLSWGHLSDDAEVKYIVNPNSLTLEEKRSGPNLWLFNWVAPGGGTAEARLVVRQKLFHQSVGHMLRVKAGNAQSARLTSARGQNVSDSDYLNELRRMNESFVKAMALKQS
jgi:cytolysin-activating lysine-acyltransferase